MPSENKMGTAPIVPLVLSMSLPTVFSMLVNALYNIVDSFFVAQISEEALTAVSYAMPAQMLLISVAVGTGIGMNSLIARRLGEGNQQSANQAASHGIVLSLITWGIFVLIGCLFTTPFANMMTDNQTIANYTAQYLSIVMVLSVGVFVPIAIEKILQATGNMIYPMMLQLIGAIVNMILDPIFIFGMFGLPALGIAGAAIATVIGQLCSLSFAVFVVLKKEHKVEIHFKGFKLSGQVIKDIYSVGFPAILMQSIGSVMITILNLILGNITETAVAVCGIYFKLQTFVFMPVFGLTQGVMPIMGYNYGARNRKRLMDTLKVSCLFALIVMVVGTAIFMIFPTPLLKIFDASEQMLGIGVPALRIICLSFIPAAIGILFSTLFQAINMGQKSLVLSILRQLVLILPLAYAFAPLGLNFVWSAIPIAEVVATLVAVLMFVQIRRNGLDHLA